MMDSIPWAVGEDGEKQFEGTKIGEFDKSAVELRDDQLQMLAAGLDVPGLDELVGFKMPPPRKRKPTLDSADSPLK